MELTLKNDKESLTIVSDIDRTNFIIDIGHISFSFYLYSYAELQVLKVNVDKLLTGISSEDIFNDIIFSLYCQNNEYFIEINAINIMLNYDQVKALLAYLNSIS